MRIIDAVFELVLGVGVVIVVGLGVATVLHTSIAVQMSMDISSVQGAVSTGVGIVIDVALASRVVLLLVVLMLVLRVMVFYDVLLGKLGDNVMLVGLVFMTFKDVDRIVDLLGNGMVDVFVVNWMLGDEGVVRLLHRSGLCGCGEDGKSRYELEDS